MIQVSAPGKIHLLGEHSVVYGKPALLAAINLRTTVSLSPYSLHLPRESKKLRSLRRVIEPIITKHLGIPHIPPYHLTITSQLPIGYHLGSSAAVSAATIAALLAHLGRPFDLDEINQLAFLAEKVFHGNPSGGDNTTVVYGGLIWFEKNQSPSFTQLPLFEEKLCLSPYQFVLLDSGKPLENTKTMVAYVAQRYEKNHQALDALFSKQAQLTKHLRDALQNGRQDQMAHCISQGEANLEALGVVGDTAKTIIRQVEKLGGVAKILGGGGTKKGSGMLLSWHEDQERLLKFAKDHKIKAIPIVLGGVGVRIVTSDK